MKTHLLLLTVMLSAVAGAQTAPPPPAAVAPSPDAEGMIPISAHPTSQIEQDVKVPAAIQWENPKIEITVGPTDTKVDFEFKGTNLLKEPLEVGLVKPSCGCQYVRINGTKFEPGAQIRLKGIMQFPPASGRYERPIRIFTSKGGPTEVSVAALAPKRVDLSSSELSWEKNDLSPKTLTITTIEPGIVEKVQVLGGGFTEKITHKDTVTTVTVIPDGKSTRGALRITEKGNPRPSYIPLIYGQVASPQTQTPAAPTTGQAPGQGSTGNKEADIKAARELLKEALKKLEAYE